MDEHWMTRVKDFATLASASIVILGATIGLIVWLGGGMKPGSQVQGEQMQISMDRLSKQVGEMSAKLDAMPRPSDYAMWADHMARLDAALDMIRQQISRIEIDNAKTNTRVDRLDGTRTRDPR